MKEEPETRDVLSGEFYRGMREAEQGKQKGRQSCGLKRTLSLAYFHGELWSVNFSTEVVSPGSRRVVLMSHIIQGFSMVCSWGRRHE